MPAPLPVGGAPCRPRWTACILANISRETLRPLSRLEMVGALLRGLRAALMLPSGVDEGVMVAVPVVAAERTEGRPAEAGGEETLEVGLEGKGGDEGEGVSKGVSESSPSGVEAVESAMADEGERERSRGLVRGARGLRNGGVEDKAKGSSWA
jgi:hypothetical protein